MSYIAYNIEITYLEILSFLTTGFNITAGIVRANKTMLKIKNILHTNTKYVFQ